MILRIEVIVTTSTGGRHSHWGVTTVPKLAQRMNLIHDRGWQVGRVLTQKEYVKLVNK